MAAEAPKDVSAIEDIRRRAAAGDAGAIANAATLAALGAGEAQSWPTALERLGRAAALGSTAAQGQLRVLSGQAEGGEGRWAELAAAVDLKPWLSPAALTPLAPGAPAAEAAGFVPPAVCAWIIDKVRGAMARAKVFDAADGSLIERPERNHSACELWMAQQDVVIALTRARIAATVGAQPGQLEVCQILRYAPGESFSPHYDFIDAGVPGQALELERRGQRIATFLVYLNDAYEGGLTSFPLLGFGYKGETGAALSFANVDPAGAPDRRTLHAGQPPVSGEKWVLSQWIRDRAGQSPYTG